MDISSQFKVYVKSAAAFKDKPTVSNDSNSIFKSKIKSSSFSKKVEAIMVHIVRLYSSLLNNNAVHVEYYKSNLTYVSDDTEIDSVAKNIINTNFKIIKELKKEISDDLTSPQNNEHRKIVVFVIEKYLKNVCEVYEASRSLRHQKAKSLKNMKLNSSEASLDTSTTTNNKLLNDESSKNNHQFSVQKLNSSDTSTHFNEEPKMLSSEDVQMFEAENEHIFSEFNIISDEIMQIENKVVRIHELQEIFMENVTTQDKNIENLLTTVVGSTQNVREANEQIRKAIQNNAGFRVWVLFFLLLMSFTLIFLDWYNP